MFSKSKYDVMESINTKSSMNLLFLVGKVAKDLKLYENKKISNLEFSNRFNKNVTSGIPCIKAICHVGYENSKDMLSISDVELDKYLKSEGLSLKQFYSNYRMMINTYVRVLMAFNVIEEEKIDIYSIMTPDMLINLMKGDFSGLKDIIEKTGVNLKKENKDLIDRLVKKDFDITMLNKEEISSLEKIHFQYMEMNVNGKVNVDSDKSKVLKYAKSLGKKKSVFEL